MQSEWPSPKARENVEKDGFHLSSKGRDSPVLLRSEAGSQHKEKKKEIPYPEGGQGRWVKGEPFYLRGGGKPERRASDTDKDNPKRKTRFIRHGGNK